MVKPLISDKGSKSNTNITLLDDSKIFNDPSDVCCLLNDYFVNVTKDIGIQDAIIDSDTIDSCCCCCLPQSVRLFSPGFLGL